MHPQDSGAALVGRHRRADAAEHAATCFPFIRDFPDEPFARRTDYDGKPFGGEARQAPK